jgi:glycosyltransferase involved in cell wall biosynthesis
MRPSCPSCPRRPVIASAVGALPELVGAAGILVPPREPQRLAAALLTAWTDRRVVEQARSTARAMAEDRWDWADVARATREVYAQVGAVERPGQPGR